MPTYLRRVVQVLTRLQTCSSWVVRDVIAEIVELRTTPHQMVERVLLPEPAASIQPTVDLRRGVVFPRFALRQHGLLVGECGQKMHVIRHDDEVEQHVPLLIEMVKALRDNPGQVRVPEDTVAVSGIERVVPAIPKQVKELSDEFWMSEL